MNHEDTEKTVTTKTDKDILADIGKPVSSVQKYQASVGL